MNPRRVGIALAVAAALLAGWYWFGGGEEAAIRERLSNLAAEINASTTDGLGTVARAAAIGSYFTDDVVVELNSGGSPIRGREMLMGMAARLQPRTAAFTLEFDDIRIDLADDETSAEVNLTAEIFRRAGAQSEETIDAREFTATMRKEDGEWRIARVSRVDIFH